MAHAFCMNDLLSETLRLARDCDAPVVDVCRVAGVKLRWYYKFVAEEFTDPGVTKVERLNRALKNMKGQRAA